MTNTTATAKPTPAQHRALTEAADRFANGGTRLVACRSDMYRRLVAAGWVDGSDITDAGLAAIGREEIIPTPADTTTPADTSTDTSADADLVNAARSTLNGRMTAGLISGKDDAAGRGMVVAPPTTLNALRRRALIDDAGRWTPLGHQVVAAIDPAAAARQTNVATGSLDNAVDRFLGQLPPPNSHRVGRNADDYTPGDFGPEIDRPLAGQTTAPAERTLRQVVRLFVAAHVDPVGRAAIRAAVENAHQQRPVDGFPADLFGAGATAIAAVLDELVAAGELTQHGYGREARYIEAAVTTPERAGGPADLDQAVDADRIPFERVNADTRLHRATGVQIVRIGGMWHVQAPGDAARASDTSDYMIDNVMPAAHSAVRAILVQRAVDVLGCEVWHLTPAQREHALLGLPFDVDRQPITVGALVECVGSETGTMTGRRGLVKQASSETDGPGRVAIEILPARPGAELHARSANRVRVIEQHDATETPAGQTTIASQETPTMRAKLDAMTTGYRTLNTMPAGDVLTALGFVEGPDGRYALADYDVDITRTGVVWHAFALIDGSSERIGHDADLGFLLYLVAGYVDSLADCVEQADGFTVGDLVQWASLGDAAGRRWRIARIYVPRTPGRGIYAGLDLVDDPGPGKTSTAAALSLLVKIAEAPRPTPTTLHIRGIYAKLATLAAGPSDAEVAASLGELGLVLRTDGAYESPLGVYVTQHDGAAGRTWWAYAMNRPGTSERKVLCSNQPALATALPYVAEYLIELDESIGRALDDAYRANGVTVAIMIPGAGDLVAGASLMIEGQQFNVPPRHEGGGTMFARRLGETIHAAGYELDGPDFASVGVDTEAGRGYRIRLRDFEPVRDADGNPVPLPAPMHTAPLDLMRQLYAGRVAAPGCPHYMLKGDREAGATTCEKRECVELAKGPRQAEATREPEERERVAQAFRPMLDTLADTADPASRHPVTVKIGRGDDVIDPAGNRGNASALCKVMLGGVAHPAAVVRYPDRPGDTIVIMTRELTPAAPIPGATPVDQDPDREAGSAFAALRAAVELHRPQGWDKYAYRTDDPGKIVQYRCGACGISVPAGGCKTWQTGSAVMLADPGAGEAEHHLPQLKPGDDVVDPDGRRAQIADLTTIKINGTRHRLALVDYFDGADTDASTPVLVADLRPAEPLPPAVGDPVIVESIVEAHPQQSRTEFDRATWESWPPRRRAREVEAVGVEEVNASGGWGAQVVDAD